MSVRDLILKYNVPVPRYTSYPTVPLWENPSDLAAKWPRIVQSTFEETNKEKGISLYMHLPFCESLCTYCGCFQHITINHAVEKKYIDCLLKEWSGYLELFDEKPEIREIHLGGGTPTFFSPENLNRLVTTILDSSGNKFSREFSFEGHPNNTKRGHLQALYDLGFRRVSFGVQDFDEKIQHVINRIQPYENVERSIKDAREVGYKSVNFDLVYGLPFQTEEIVATTFQKVLDLRPERIAYYSYAHVPWKRPGQRRYTESDLPDNELKRRLYEIGKEMLQGNGYREIGMDHFALPQDDLFIAQQNGQLHRNFMGYTVTNTELLIGLGASSISDAKGAFAQNIKKVKEYENAVESGDSLLTNGHVLSKQDLVIRRLIKSLICNSYASFSGFSLAELPKENLQMLNQMEAEGLLDLNNEEITVTKLGKVFIRNICSAFDLRMAESKTEEPRYSKAI